MAIRPPSGYSDHLSRRDAARLLGFASEFKVRQLEKEGRLHSVRGAMGSAWYPRDQIAALGRELVSAAAPVRDRADDPGRLGVRRRWLDGDLIAHLREGADREVAGVVSSRARTAVDLVVDAGVPISRAERVYRFWLANDAHPAAVAARAARGVAPPRAATAERRSQERLERDDLIQKIRDPDPAVRAAVFDKLKKHPA